jgi:hypothetical protein
MIDGAPLTTSLPMLAVVTVWGVAAFLVALRIFRWQ